MMDDNAVAVAIIAAALVGLIGGIVLVKIGVGNSYREAAVEHGCAENERLRAVLRETISHGLCERYSGSFAGMYFVGCAQHRNDDEWCVTCAAEEALKGGEDE